ncbi:hypothetical protein D3C71_1871850 [compost metagenome]
MGGWAEDGIAASVHIHCGGGIRQLYQGRGPNGLCPIQHHRANSGVGGGAGDAVIRPAGQADRADLRRRALLALCPGDYQAPRLGEGRDPL